MDLKIEVACPSMSHAHAKMSKNIEEEAGRIWLARALSYRINTFKSSHNSSQTIYPRHKQVWKTWDAYRAVRGGQGGAKG